MDNNPLELNSAQCASGLAQQALENCHITHLRLLPVTKKCEAELSIAKADIPYDHTFFSRLNSESLAAATVVVPLVMHLIRAKSVVDIGCGHGVWLSVFRDSGVPDVLGIDGPWVSVNELQIPSECFLRYDLTDIWHVPRSFDLALSLEVGEHLPPSASRRLVAELTNAAPAVLFSAAIPGQGGKSHINEQWPEYWDSLFRVHGFTRLDPIRRLIWMEPRVAWYYQQNLFLYVSEKLLACSPSLQAEKELTNQSDLVLVHRKILGHARSFKGAAKLLLSLGCDAFKRKLARFFHSKE